MIKIVWSEFVPRLGNGRPENGTGTFVEALMCPALSSQGFELTTLYTTGRASSLPIISTTSGDENGRSDSMKYWEIIADKLSAAGFFVGLLQRGDQRWLAIDFDAHKGDGKRYIVHSDEPVAFMELEATRAISPNANIG